VKRTKIRSKANGYTMARQLCRPTLRRTSTRVALPVGASLTAPKKAPPNVPQPLANLFRRTLNTTNTTKITKTQICLILETLVRLRNKRPQFLVQDAEGNFIQKFLVVLISITNIFFLSVCRINRRIENCRGSSNLKRRTDNIKN
jgi:hypothetical protein